MVVRWTGVRVRVEVTDADAARPQPRDAPLEAENGRGLLLVELGRRVGSASDPAGKVVWFEVGPPDPAPPAKGWRLVDQVRAVLPFTLPATHPARYRRPGRFSRSAVAGSPR